MELQGIQNSQNIPKKEEKMLKNSRFPISKLNYKITPPHASSFRPQVFMSHETFSFGE